VIPIHLVKTLSIWDLQGSAEYLDEDGNVIRSFVQGLYKCQGGFYSFNQITARTYPQVGWWILLTILIAAVFVIIIDSYWPMLFTIYAEINELPVRLHEEFVEFHMKLSDIFSVIIQNIKSNLIGHTEIGKIKEEEDLEKYKEPPEVKKFKLEKKHVALGCWVVTCILASFIAALFISLVGLTIIQSNMVKEEEICKKLELIDVNKQDLTEGNSTEIKEGKRRLGAVFELAKNLENWGINVDSKGRVLPKIKILSEVEDENGNVTLLISMPVIQKLRMMEAIYGR
jgi:hypothetical protein